jgi:endo-1,4-beta-mannosidase
MTTQEKVAHLNKLTMSALTLNEGNVTDMNDELYEYIQDLGSEGIVVQVGDSSYVYSEDEMRVVDRLLA